MKKLIQHIALFGGLLPALLFAQPAAGVPHPGGWEALPVEAKVDWLLQDMTLEEKVEQFRKPLRKGESPRRTSMRGWANCFG